MTKKQTDPCAHLRLLLWGVLQSSKRVVGLKVPQDKLGFLGRSLKLLSPTTQTCGDLFHRLSSRRLASTALWGNELSLLGRGKAERPLVLQLLLSLSQLHAQLADLGSQALDVLVLRGQLRIRIDEQALSTDELLLQPPSVAL